MWSVATSPITAGIRKCNSNQILTLFTTIVKTKLFYGLELVELNESDVVHLNTQARICLKALIWVSKKSKNLLHKIYNILDVNTLINKRKLTLLKQSTSNPCLASYVYHLLSSSENISYSFIFSAIFTANCLNLDVSSLRMIMSTPRLKLLLWTPPLQKLTTVFILLIIGMS